jgi:hypothetical protein
MHRVQVFLAACRGIGDKKKRLPVGIHNMKLDVLVSIASCRCHAISQSGMSGKVVASDIKL